MVKELLGGGAASFGGGFWLPYNEKGFLIFRIQGEYEETMKKI